MDGVKLTAILIYIFCSLTSTFAGKGFDSRRRLYQNLEYETQKVKNSIRPDLLRSLEPTKQNVKVEEIMERRTISQLEEALAKFRQECIENNQKNILPAIKQFAKRIEKKGGLGNFTVVELMEWFMKSMVDLLTALDHAMGSEYTENWPRYQVLKQLFVDIVKPIEELVVHLYPLPEYKYTSDMLDGDKGEMRYIDEMFENWAETLHANTSVRTFYPRTVAGIQEIIRMAGDEGARVRASGIRHTTTPWIWGADSSLQPQVGHSLDYVIAMVPQEVSDQLAYARDSEGWEDDTDLVFVEGPVDVWEENGKKFASMRIGSSSLNSHYQEWALAENWTLPTNTIQHLMTIGGVATGMCHGAGIMHKTIADSILKIEYVDSQGELQYVDDPDLLPAAAGSLGLLGIVTAITYRVEEMSYARFWPRHWPGGIDAFFNFEGDIPEETVELMKNSYYFEMMQFPVHHNYSGVLFVDAWDNLGRAEDSGQLLTTIEEDYQEAYMLLGELANRVFRFIQKSTKNIDFLYWTYGLLTAWDSSLGMVNFESAVTTTITEAMHWERGIHYISTNLFEMNIPIPATADGQPNWEIVRQSWRDMTDLNAEFEKAGKYPYDLAMESRLVEGSNILLAPQHGNLWTQSIEISGSPLVPREVWEEFKTALAERWSTYTDPLTGEKLNIRPHWAKEFPNQVGEDDFTSFAQKAFGNQIPVFINALKQVIESNNGNFEKSIDMFSTKYLDAIFHEYYE